MREVRAGEREPQGREDAQRREREREPVRPRDERILREAEERDRQLLAALEAPAPPAEVIPCRGPAAFDPPVPLAKTGDDDHGAAGAAKTLDTFAWFLTAGGRTGGVLAVVAMGVATIMLPGPSGPDALAAGASVLFYSVLLQAAGVCCRMFAAVSMLLRDIART